MPDARFSARSMVYVYALREGTDEITFTQVTAIHRRAIGDRDPDEVERRLTIDALSRAKHRIMDQSYTTGQAYTVELDESDLLE